MKVKSLTMKDFEKHKNFLLKYAVENNIVFRVSRSGISVGIWNRPEKLTTVIKCSKCNTMVKASRHTPEECKEFQKELKKK